MPDPPTPSARGPAVPASLAPSSEVLARIEQRLAVLEERTAWIDMARVTAPKIAAIMADTADDYAEQVEDAGLQLDSLLPRLGRLATRVAIALQGAQRAAPAPKGLFAALRVLKDPDVREALGYALGVAKEFGRMTRKHGRRALPSPGATH